MFPIIENYYCFWLAKVKVTHCQLQQPPIVHRLLLDTTMCVCPVRMTRENSAGSEMSKLLSFGYLDTTQQSPVDNRKSSAGTRYQPSAAGVRTTPQSGYQATTSHQSSVQPTGYSDFMMTGYQADQQSAAGTMPSSPTNASLPPAAVHSCSSYACVGCLYCSKKVFKLKFSYTRYRVLGPQLILAYRQSARRWRHRPLTGTKLYCLVTEAHRCEQLVLPKVAMQLCPRWELNSGPNNRKSNALPLSH